MGYFTQSDLEGALSKNVVKLAYDDDHSQTVDAGAMAACIAYATAQVNSFLRGYYPGPPGFNSDLVVVPDEVKFAALDFGIAYTIRRRPDVVKALNEQPWTVFRDSAIEQMKRYQSTLQRLPPSGLGAPSNVGASTIGEGSPDPTDGAPGVPDDVQYPGDPTRGTGGGANLNCDPSSGGGRWGGGTGDF